MGLVQYLLVGQPPHFFTGLIYMILQARTDSGDSASVFCSKATSLFATNHSLEAANSLMKKNGNY